MRRHIHQLGALCALTIMLLTVSANAQCPVDIDGDDEVGVNELLGLLGAWGTNHPVFDVTGDFEVDVNDLLLVLGAWGPCLHVAGATCGTAIALDDFCSFSCVETVFGTTVGYVGWDISSCGINDWRDRWYRYTVTCTTQPWFTVFSTCKPGTNFDTTLTVYQGTCAGLVEIGCNNNYNDPSCQIGGINRKSQLLIENLQEGTPYYIRVSGYNSASGNFELEVNTQCFPG